MRLSVVVTAYNEQDNIKRCLDSILNQDYAHYEVIVIDDGSTDKTAQIVELDYKNRVRLVSQKNTGISGARNKGIKEAKGEYIIFIDGDDSIEPNSLSKVMTAVYAHGYDFAAFDYYKNKKLISINVKNSYIVDVTPFVWNKVIKKKLFTKNRICFPEGRIYEEPVVLAKLIMNSTKSGVINIPVTKYQQRSNRLSTQAYSFKKIKDLYYNLNEFNDYPDNPEIEYMYIKNIFGTAAKRIILGSSKPVKDLDYFLKMLNKKYPNWKDNPFLAKDDIFQKTYISSVEKKRIAFVKNALIVKGYDH